VAAAIVFASMTATPVAGQTPAAAKARTAAPAKAYAAAHGGRPSGSSGRVGFPQRHPALERPSQFAGKEFLTDQEVAEYEKSAHERLDMDRRDEDPTRTPPVVNGLRHRHRCGAGLQRILVGLREEVRREQAELVDYRSGGRKDSSP
jgi:hypothetical protein